MHFFHLHRLVQFNCCLRTAPAHCLHTSPEGWQKLREAAKDLRRKVWTPTLILSPYIRYFVAILRFVAIYAILGGLWAKKCFFWVKAVFLGQGEYMVYFAYYTDFILQIL